MVYLPIGTGVFGSTHRIPMRSRGLNEWPNICGGGVSLIFARTETRAWQKWVWPYAHCVLFPAGRIAFCLPDGTRKAGAGAPSAFVSYSAFDTERLIASGIKGAFVRRME
jgi:hypothetical protein